MLRKSIFPGALFFLVLWILLLIILFVTTGYSMTSAVSRSKSYSTESHDTWVNPNSSLTQEIVSDDTYSGDNSHSDPTIVSTGIYVDRITELSFKDSYWIVEFYIWFRWEGDSVQPGENFQVIQGSIESKIKEFESVQDQAHYEEYRVLARITRHFDESRFPRDDHLLTIQIEDSACSYSQLSYRIDEKDTGISNLVEVPGYEIYRTGGVVKTHKYDTGFGDPAAPLNHEDTYSQFNYGIFIDRPDWGFYIKTFQGLFIAVFASLLALVISPSHTQTRFALGIGALFAAIANTYITQSYLPNTGIMTLTDMVNGISMFTILLVLVQCTISLYFQSKWGKERATFLMERLPPVILLAGYISINIILPIAASI